MNYIIEENYTLVCYEGLSKNLRKNKNTKYIEIPNLYLYTIPSSFSFVSGIKLLDYEVEKINHLVNCTDFNDFSSKLDFKTDMIKYGLIEVNCNGSTIRSTLFLDLKEKFGK